MRAGVARDLRGAVAGDPLQRLPVPVGTLFAASRDLIGTAAVRSLAVPRAQPTRWLAVPWNPRLLT
jgi:hypothetical protein